MPLDPKLNKFTTASPIIASFDAVDFEDGTGIVIYTASRASISATEANDEFLLNRDVIVPTLPERPST